MSDPTNLPLFSTPQTPETETPAPRPSARALAGRLGGSRPTPPPAPTEEMPAPEPAPVDESVAPAEAGWYTDVDYATVREIQRRVIETFQNEGESRLTGAITLEQHGEVINGLIESHATDLINDGLQRGQKPPRAAERRAMSVAVHNAIFGAGRLQALLDLDGIENIEADGYDNVWLEFADGRMEQGPHIADSDDELIADIQQLARFSSAGEKDFSIATKKLRMALPDGSRLAAHAWLTPRPSLVIRKHRYIDTDLAQMRDLGAIEAGLESFLAAATRAGKNIVVVGPPAAGKTTMTRAMLNSLDPMKRIATIESMYELGMHKLPHRHRRVFAAEAQAGGERDGNGQPLGAHTLTDLHQSALQMNVDYIVVGEVLGSEIMAMLEAMQAGKGSMSTMHASSAWDAVERMSTLITMARSNTNPQFAAQMIALYVDLIVFVDVIDERQLPGGRRHRHVAEVLSLTPNHDTDASPVTREYLWEAGPDGRASATGKRPEWLADLIRHGFDPSHLEAGTTHWERPLDLVVPKGGHR